MRRRTIAGAIVALALAGPVLVAFLRRRAHRVVQCLDTVEEWYRAAVLRGDVTVGGFREYDTTDDKPPRLRGGTSGWLTVDDPLPEDAYDLARRGYITRRAEFSVGGVPVDDVVFIDDGTVDLDAMRAAADDTSGLDVFREEFTRIDGTGIDVGIITITREHDPMCDDDGWDHPGDCVIETCGECNGIGDDHTIACSSSPAAQVPPHLQRFTGRGPGR